MDKWTKRKFTLEKKYGVAGCHGFSVYCRQEYAPITLLPVFAWIEPLRHSFPGNQRKAMTDFFDVFLIVGARDEAGSFLFPV